MASIRVRQRKDGTVYTSVLYVHEGKQTSSSFNDHAEALKFQDVVNRLGPAEAPRIWGATTPAAGHTVASFIDEHLDGLSGVEKKTIVEYRRYLVRDIEPLLGDIPLSTLTPIDVSRWVNKMRDSGVSGKTVQNKFGFLSGCLNAAVRQGLIPANPATGVRLPRTPHREMAFLTHDEFMLLCDAFTPRWRPLLTFLVSSGCRFSEATALQPSDVNRTNATVHIARAWKRIPGGEGGRYEIGAPKTPRSVRTIDIPPEVLDELDYAREWVFTNSEGGPIRLYSWRSNVWVPSLARARRKDPANPDQPVLGKKVRIHDLRHTCASWLLGAGVPLNTVSGHLGHENVATTSRVYGHLDRTAGKAAAAAMAECLKA